MTKDRVIVTKGGVYAIPDGMEGIPLEDAFSGTTVPQSLQGAKLYHTPQGMVIARPERPEETKPTEAKTRAAAENEKPVVFRPGARKEYVRARDAHFHAKRATAYEKVKITAQPMRFFGQWKGDIEIPKIAAEEARVLLMRHFPEGPGRAAVALKAAKRYRAALDKHLKQEATPRPKISDLARRWGMFCHDLGNAARAHYDAGLRPAMVDPYAIDFSRVHLSLKDRKAALLDRGIKPERGGDRGR